MDGAMKPFFDFTRAVRRDMGWCKVQFLDKEGRVTRVEEYGTDPLADKRGSPKVGYWQSPDDRRKLSTEEDEAGL